MAKAVEEAFFFYDAEEMPWEEEGEEKRHRAVIYTLESLPETAREASADDLHSVKSF